MVRFERTITIHLETPAEAALYIEALELAADNAPTYDAPGATGTPSEFIEIKSRVACLSGTRPTAHNPARITLSPKPALLLATALEVLEEMHAEKLAEQAAARESTGAPDAELEARARMLEGAAEYLRAAVRS